MYLDALLGPPSSTLRISPRCSNRFKALLTVARRPTPEDSAKSLMLAQTSTPSLTFLPYTTPVLMSALYTSRSIGPDLPPHEPCTTCSNEPSRIPYTSSLTATL